MTVVWLMFLAASSLNAAGDPAKWFRINDEGIALTKIPDYPAAEARFRAALMEAETIGEQDYRVWATLSNLALVRQEQGDYGEAEKLYLRTIGLRQKYLGPDRPEVAAALNNLAAALHAAGRNAEADPLLRRALVIADAARDDKLTASILNTLALVLTDLGEPARAEPVLRRSIALFEKSVGPDALEVGKAFNNLAMLHRLSGQYETAEAELRRALPMYEKYLGAGHPLTAIVLNNFYTLLAEQKRYAEGEPYLRRALSICENQNPGSAALAQMRANLATLEGSRGHFEAAARILEDVIAWQEKMLGPQHPRLAESLQNYSFVLRQLHQKAQAKRAGNRAAAILKTFR